MSAVISEALLKEVKATQKKNKKATVSSLQKMYQEHAKKANSKLKFGLDAAKVSLIDEKAAEVLAF